MESQPQNPEFKNNPENFQTCIYAKEKHIKRNVSADRMLQKKQSGIEFSSE